MLAYLYPLIRFIIGSLVLLIVFFLGCRIRQHFLRQTYTKKYGKNEKLLTFIHPNCFDFGGGEKVLWMIIDSITKLEANSLNFTYRINIISTHLQRNALQELFDIDNPISKLGSHKDLLKKLNERFSIKLEICSDLIKAIDLVEIQSTRFFKPSPFLTMLFQIVFQMLFALEILMKTYVGEVVIDTTGLPFSYAILSAFGNIGKLSAYVHYPFISEDMVSDIRKGVDGVHSRGLLSKHKSFIKLKLFYYLIILKFYKYNCRFLKFIFTNSTWTYTHMNSIVPEVSNQILYPPCAIGVYKDLSENNVNYSISNRQNVILSFAQFRPEKNHKLQIDIFNAVRKQLPKLDIKLCLMGGVRNEEDQRLFNDMQDYAKKLGLNDSVEFLPNLPSADVKKRFQNAKVAIHTMRDEHFGISVIEMMCAGLITIAHNSAGPQKDIIGSSPNQVGLLCEGKLDVYCLLIFFFYNKSIKGDYFLLNFF